MSDNLKAASGLAGLSPQQREQINALSKALSTHRQLLALPSDVAAEEFNRLPKEQQASLKQTFGEDDSPNMQQGWFKSAKHYLLSYNPVTLAFKGIIEASDLSTRAYRTLSIAGDQNVSLAKAWGIANDKGDKVFRPDAIRDARAKYGADRINAAMKLASGMSMDEAFASGTDAEKAILSEYRNGRKDGLFEDALNAVQESKYSPGRDLASALGLRGTGAYKWVSGIGDAAYRIFADPTLLAGKAKRMYDVTKYSLDVMIGGNKVNQVFAKPQVRAFWDQYGSLLGKLDDAETTLGKASAKIDRAYTMKAALDKKIAAGVELTDAEKLRFTRIKEILDNASPGARKAAEEAAMFRTELQRLAPDLGPTVIKEFNAPGVKIRNAQDAQNWFENAKDLTAIMAGQAGRNVPLMPRLNAARKTRIALYTATDKVFNLNKVGPAFLKASYVDGAGDETGDIITGIITNAEQTGANIRKGMATQRFTLNDVYRRMDRFAAKFEKIPYTRDGFINMNDPNATTIVYRIARLALPRYQSKIISEAFDASDVGKKKEIINGLWETIAAVRGVNKTPAGLDMLNKLKGVGTQAYAPIVRAVDDNGKVVRADYLPGAANGKPMALIEYQLSDAMAMPSIRDMDALAARSGITGHIVGFSHQKWVEKVTNYWSFLTLAGPRFALRNATEDMMMHLAVGSSPWGIAKGRMLSTTLRLAREGHDVGVFNRFVKYSDRAKYRSALDAIKVADDISDAEKVARMRGLMAQAVTESKLGRILDKEELEFLQDHIRLGGIDNMLAEVSEGAKNMFKGTDQAIRAKNLSAQFNGASVAALKFDDVLYRRRFGKGAFANFAPAASPENQVAWINLINSWSADKIGSIAIKNLDGVNGNANAIRAVREFLSDPANKDLLGKFRLEANGVSIEQHATAIVDTAAALFSKGNGSLNREFYRKVVDEAGNIRATSLSLDDLPKIIDDTPRMLSGPTFIPVAEGDNITANLIEKGWDWMGEMNARYSREPIVIDTMLRIRRDMAKNGFDKQFIARFVQNGSSEEYARKQLAALVEQRAINHTLSYVDNPAVQTQMAFAARNFARFYRATEDFWRRAARAIRYNPDALARAALVYDGVAHSGWVQEDANGESYFLYPAMTPVYKAMQATLTVFGVKPAFKTPLPVQFGGKLNMVTPSLNPDSLMPTLAGPVAGLSVNVVSNIVGIWNPEAGASIKTTALGPYAENQDFISAVLPAHINRAYAYLNRDEKNGQYASAFRKAVTYLEAAGHAPKPTIDPATGEEIPPSPEVLEKYQDQLKSVTSAILATRFVFGFFAPASPQIDYKSDMADWVRDSGRSSWKQVWNGLLAQYEGDVDRAMADWVKYFPSEMPYTVSESEKQVRTFVRASEKAGAFMQNNKDLFERYPQGAAFLMPLTGEFTYEAYKILRQNGLYAPKAVGDFLREVQAAGDYATYNQQRRQYEADLAASPFDWQKRQLREQWENWSRSFKGARPLLQEQMATYSIRQPQKIQALNDLENLLADKSVKVAPKTRAALKQMLDLYTQYKVTSEDTLMGEEFKSMTKQGILLQMQQIAGANPNAGAAYSSIFSDLMGV